MPPKVTITSESRLLESVEPVPLAPGDDDRRGSYPYPYLRISGAKRESRSRLAVLENEFLRAKFDLDLGGRLISLVELPGGDECLPVARESLEETGPRGVRWRAGLCWSVGGSLRDDLAPIDFIVEEPEGEDPAVLWLFAILGGTGLSYHARFGLSTASRALEAEFRVINRTLEGRAYDPSIDCGFAPNWLPRGAAVGRCGLAWQPGAFARSSGSRIERFAQPEWLAPRHSDSFRLTILPLPKWDEALGVLPEVAIGRRGQSLVVSPAVPYESSKVFVSVDGQTMEASLPERTLETLEFGGFQHKAFQLSDGRWLFGTEGADVAHAGPLEPSSRYAVYLGELRNTRAKRNLGAGWEQALFDSALRPACHILKASVEAGSDQFADSSVSLEEALAWNAEDPLTWISKAIIDRLAGEEGEDLPELPNAHYLAPLEPLLRAAAFLSQQHYGKEPSPLVAPLAHDPEALVDVACFLIDLGVGGEALKWIDECWRHREVAMLQYLAAYALHRSTRMGAEAAQRIAMVSRMPINPPYPWRESERTVLSALASEFPHDARLAEMLRMLEWGMADLTIRPSSSS